MFWKGLVGLDDPGPGLGERFRWACYALYALMRARLPMREAKRDVQWRRRHEPSARDHPEAAAEISQPSVDGVDVARLDRVAVDGMQKEVVQAPHPAKRAPDLKGIEGSRVESRETIPSPAGPESLADVVEEASQLDEDLAQFSLRHTDMVSADVHLFGEASRFSHQVRPFGGIGPIAEHTSCRRPGSGVGVAHRGATPQAPLTRGGDGGIVGGRCRAGRESRVRVRRLGGSGPGGGAQLSSVKVLSAVVNNVVVVTEGRRLPGLVVQGDRLHKWLRLARAGDADSIEMLEDEMRLSVAEFDRVCKAEGYPLL